jgi:hypothetical protein
MVPNTGGHGEDSADGRGLYPYKVWQTHRAREGTTLHFLEWQVPKVLVGSSLYSVAGVPGVYGAFVVTLRSMAVHLHEW